ncbi:hypothetical protein DID80_00825 [Candidatus Marinamargulisbacteria bacterium SCGC AAA071-K20]|nr:hypothetical protein DID80_00825 [Candidatus Marinamargulisbacteria bacterium SCGC AAA071-K20]
MFISTSPLFAKKAVSRSLARVEVGAIQRHSYRSGTSISNIDIDQAIYSTSAIMAKRLNIPIYDNSPEYLAQNHPVAASIKTNQSISSKQSKTHISASQSSNRPSFADVANSLKKNLLTKNEPSTIVILELKE